MRELSEEELMVIVATVNHIKNMVEEHSEKKGDWGKITTHLEELIELATQGLSVRLINRLYKSASF